MPGQPGSAYRFDWGAEGLDALAPHVAVVVIVDALRFTSAVSAAVEAGCTVIPARWADEGAAAVAAATGAILAALDPSAAVSAPRCSPEAAAARAAFVAALDVTDLAAQLVGSEFVGT